MRSCPRCSTAYDDDVSTCPLDGAALSSGPRPDPLINRIVKGRYRILAKLGAGGMGAVYRAEQLSVGRTVALKVLHVEFARDEEFVQRFHQEARLAAALNHPRLTTVFDFDQSEDGSLFIVMEYLEGTLLSDLIRQSGPLDVARAIRLAVQIAEGIAAAHAAGVIHRDIKPQNVMVLAPGDGVKLMDFGIARLSDGREVQLTRAGALMGTPLYMAPEQIEGHPVSEKTDIYAFGIVLYEMLSGQTPFSAPTSAAVLARQLNEPARPLRALRPEVPPVLEQIVMQALEKDPQFRQDRVADIVRRLQTVAGPAATTPADTQVLTTTMASRPAHSPIPVSAPAVIETMLVTPTMVSGHGAEPVGTGERLRAPEAVAGQSLWSRLREHYGKVIAISAGLVMVLIAAIVIWRMAGSGPAGTPVATVPQPPPVRPAPIEPPGRQEPLPPGEPVLPKDPALPKDRVQFPKPVPPSVPAPTPTPLPSPTAKPLPSVPPPSPPAAPDPSPNAIRASVEETLRDAGFLAQPNKPGLVVKDVGANGNVVLGGAAQNEAALKQAVALAHTVKGVTAVKHNVALIESWKSQ